VQAQLLRRAREYFIFREVQERGKATKQEMTALKGEVEAASAELEPYKREVEDLKDRTAKADKDLKKLDSREVRLPLTGLGAASDTALTRKDSRLWLMLIAQVKLLAEREKLLAQVEGADSEAQAASVKLQDFHTRRQTQERQLQSTMDDLKMAKRQRADFDVSADAWRSLSISYMPSRRER
jgi:chromosome segregation ATPase